MFPLFSNLDFEFLVGCVSVRFGRKKITSKHPVIQSVQGFGLGLERRLIVRRQLKEFFSHLIWPRSDDELQFERIGIVLKFEQKHSSRARPSLSQGEYGWLPSLYTKSNILLG